MELDILFRVVPERRGEVKGLDELLAPYPFRNNDWTIPQAYLCVLLAAGAADGRFTVEEEQEIKALAGRTRTLKLLRPEQLAEINTEVAKRMRERHGRALQEACEALPQDLRLSIFAHCVDIVLADGELVAAEKDFLGRLLVLMKLDPHTVLPIIEVIVLKNRF